MKEHQMLTEGQLQWALIAADESEITPGWYQRFVPNVGQGKTEN